MKRHQRKMTDQEAAGALNKVSFLQFRLRRLAREDRQQGVVDVLQFDVARVWTLITCTGPPCCPNTWLIETTDSEFVYATHWEFLNQIDGKFPGRHVELCRYPLSKRLIGDHVNGDPVQLSELPVELWKVEMAINLPGYVECDILPGSPFPVAEEYKRP